MKRLSFIMLWPLALVECYLMALVAKWLLTEVGNQNVTSQGLTLLFVGIAYVWVLINRSLHRQEYLKTWLGAKSVLDIAVLPFWPIVLPTAAICVAGGVVGCFVGVFIWAALDELVHLPGKLVRYVRYGDPNGLAT